MPPFRIEGLEVRGADAFGFDVAFRHGEHQDAAIIRRHAGLHQFHNGRWDARQRR